MADTKISALPASTTPLAGTEVLPIVQSSTTKQVSVANLTAGRSFDALGMVLTSTDAGAAAAPLLELYRDSATPAASDTLGEIEFNGEDSAGNKQAYGLIHASILSPTSTAEQGQLHFETATAGALTEKMIIGTTNLVINEIGAIYNVRIEGDTDANLFYTDATNSRVGVGTLNPASKLDVVGGDLTVSSGNLILGTLGKGINLPYAAIKSSNTSGDFTISVSGLSTLSGAAWRKNSMIVYYSGIDGAITNGTDLLTVVEFGGLSTYSASVIANIVGTAVITTANPTSTGIDVTFDVSNSNEGSVMVFLLGGAQGGSPQISITP